MILIDTHTHLYLDDFDDDWREVIDSAIESGVKYMLLPRIDSETSEDQKKLGELYPENCLSMVGLHPTSVNEDYEKELEIMESALIDALSTIDRNYSMGVSEIRLSMVLEELNEQESADRYRSIGTNRLNTWFIPKKKMELTEDRAVEIVVTFDQGKDLPWHPKK